MCSTSSITFRFGRPINIDFVNTCDHFELIHEKIRNTLKHSHSRSPNQSRRRNVTINDWIEVKQYKTRQFILYLIIVLVLIFMTTSQLRSLEILKPLSKFVNIFINLYAQFLHRALNPRAIVFFTSSF